MADIIKKGSESNNHKPTAVEGPYISVRALYATPSKKSRRRGDINGSVHLLLTAPPPKLPDQLKLSSSTKAASTKKDIANTNDPTKTTTTTTTDENGVTNKTTTTKPIPKKQEETTPVDKSDTPVLTQTEKSRLTAIGRLQLLRAVEAMQRHTIDDAKGKQLFHKLIVQTSASQKTWKDKDSHRDRREGTIFNTGDYKHFFETQSKFEQDRNDRPKPLPGGGLASMAEDATNGEKLSAIVLHLRSKREEQSRRKKAKKKSQKDAKKSGKSGGSGNNTNSNTDKKQDGGGKSKGSSKGRRNRGRGGSGSVGGSNRDGGGKKKSSMTPVILAKPPGK